MNPIKDTHTLPSCALYVEAEDPEGHDALPLPFSGVADQVGPAHVHLVLTQGHLRGEPSTETHTERLRGSYRRS